MRELNVNEVQTVNGGYGSLIYWGIRTLVALHKRDQLKRAAKYAGAAIGFAITYIAGTEGED